MKKKTAHKKKTVKNVCHDCPAFCCHDLTMHLTKPRTKHEIEKISWYLHFDNIKVFIKNYRWHLIVNSRCRYLSLKKNLCTIYEKRPEVCREHSNEGCEATGKWYDTLLTCPEEFHKYLAKKIKNKK